MITNSVRDVNTNNYENWSIFDGYLKKLKKWRFVLHSVVYRVNFAGESKNLCSLCSCRLIGDNKIVFVIVHVINHEHITSAGNADKWENRLAIHV